METVLISLSGVSFWETQCVCLFGFFFFCVFPHSLRGNQAKPYVLVCYFNPSGDEIIDVLTCQPMSKYIV